MKSGRRGKCFSLKYSTRKCNYSKEGTFRQHSKVTEELIVFLFRFFVFVFLSFVLLVFSLTAPEVVCKDIILMVKVNPFISIQKLLELPTQCKLVKQFNTPTPDNSHSFLTHVIMEPRKLNKIGGCMTLHLGVYRNLVFQINYIQSSENEQVDRKLISTSAQTVLCSLKILASQQSAFQINSA